MVNIWIQTLVHEEAPHTSGHDKCTQHGGIGLSGIMCGGMLSIAMASMRGEWFISHGHSSAT